MSSNIASLESDVRNLRVGVKSLLASPQEGFAIELAERQHALLRQVLPLVDREPMAVLMLIDLSLDGIVVNSMLGNYQGVVVAGMGLMPARVALASRAGTENEELEIEFNQFLGVKFDEYIVACAASNQPALAAWSCDILLNPPHRSRQFVTYAGANVANSWVKLNAIKSDFVDNPGSRQMLFSDITSMLQSNFHMLKFIFRAFRSMWRKPIPILRNPNDSFAEKDQRIWRDNVAKVADCVHQAPFEQRLSAVTGLFETMLAAKLSESDIIYVTSGSRGGAALRYFGGNRFAEPPVVLSLPALTLSTVRKWQRNLRRASAASRVNLEGYLSAIGNSVMVPIIEAWPDLKKVTIIPVGRMQGLPFSASIVAGRRISELVDIGVSPSSACMLSATMPPENFAREAVIFADSSDGIPHTHREADCIAEIYGIEPTLKLGPSPESDDCGSTTTRIRTNLELSSEKEVDPLVLEALSGSRVLHFACHGRVSGSGGHPQLELGGALCLDHLATNRLSSGSTVVLSACSAALNNPDAPLANFGFPSLFLSTGARNVIATSWELPDCEELLSFMTVLHQYIHDGESARRALAKAMQWAVNREVDPVVWAGFNCYGA